MKFKEIENFFPTLIGQLGSRLLPAIRKKLSMRERYMFSNTVGGAKRLNLGKLPKDLIIS